MTCERVSSKYRWLHCARRTPWTSCPIPLRCLIVDDSEEFLASASRLLGAQGVLVVGCASSSDHALQMASALEPDVALVDVELGEEDGVVLSRELVARAPATQVVLISSYRRDDLGDIVAQSAAAGFLAKTDLGAAAIAGLLG